MIISCGQCQTRFRLDDSRVTENGVRVRCAKCRHIFTVYKEGALKPPEDTVTSADHDAITIQIDPPTSASTTVTDAVDPEIDFSGLIATTEQTTYQQEPEPQPDTKETETSDPFQGMFKPVQVETDDETAFDFGALEDNSGAVVDEIDFGTVPEAAAETADTEFRFDLSEVTLQPPALPASDEVDLSAIDFGELSSAAPVEPEKIGFDSLDFGTVAPSAATTTSSDTSGSEDESAAPKDANQIFSFEAPESGTNLPPPVVATRHRQGSMLSILIIIVTILVLAVLGYISYSFINGGPKSLQLFGKASTPVEEGRITVQNLSAHYLPNAAAGELLVINGDAVNLYKTSRAALQVRGTVLGSNSQKLATKTAFAGNRLTDSQLLEMTAEKMDAAMNNQFGDSLINLEVPAGRPVPFTIVFVNPPAEGKDFGVEPIGSTVAAVK